MSAESIVSVRYYPLPEALRPYFTAFYSVTILCEPGQFVRDCFHPEWGGLRFAAGAPPLASIGAGEMRPQWPFSANGPTNKAIYFGYGRSRILGLGLLPAGWARFIDVPANEMANRNVNGEEHPAFRIFAPLGEVLNNLGCDQESISCAFAAFLDGIPPREVPHLQQILDCQSALRDPNVSGVAELGERIGMSARSLERMCRRYFGFPPKLLLRRQRFVRSLAHYMLDPSLTWAEALDAQYHDQAQFVRDFRSFMGLTPRKYVDLPHPILFAALEARAKALGQQGTYIDWSGVPANIATGKAG